MRTMARTLLVALALGACAGHADEEAENGGSAAIVGAQTVVVSPQSFGETVSAIGTVVARAGHSASVGVPAAGRVTQVLVTSGDRVRAGQTLVVLDPSVFAASRTSAEAAVALAEQNAERARRLLAEGIAPRKDAEQAAAELARARAELVGAERQASLATVRAPIAGVVTRVTATLGGTADPAQPLVEIADPSALDVLLGVTPADAARIRPGASVALESLGIGTVQDVGAAVEAGSVAVRVRVPAATRSMRIGETIAARITLATRANALVVPTNALVPEGDGFKVFVVDAQNVAHARGVTVGARADSLAEITAGLAAGDRIVTYGAYGMSDGARVTPSAAKP